MRKLLTICLLAAQLLLCSCAGNADNLSLSGNTRTVHIPLEPDFLLSVLVPTELQIIETDNDVYWKFNDGTIIYVTNLVVHDSDINTETQTYLNKSSASIDFVNLNKTVSILCSNNYLNTLASYLGKANIIQVDSTLFKEIEITKLPEYTDMSSSMKFSEHGLYVPNESVDSKMDIFSAELLCKGSDWLECYTLDGNYKDIVSTLSTKCIANNKESREALSGWYYDNEVLYLECSNNIIAAKKLRSNEWCVYSGTDLFKDYILTGVVKVNPAK